MSSQSLKAALAVFGEKAAALHNAKDAREAIRLEDDLAIAFARVIANLCDNTCVAADFDYVDEGGVSGLETRIDVRLSHLRAARRVIANDKREAEEVQHE